MNDIDRVMEELGNFTSFSAERAYREVAAILLSYCDLSVPRIAELLGDLYDAALTDHDARKA